LPVPDCASLHKIKTVHYNDLIAHSGVVLRPGVETLIHAGREAGLKLAIATTTSRPNVTSLLQATLGDQAPAWFAAICCGEDVMVKKPHPEVYELALAACGAGADEAIAFEDSANGLKAAKAAKLACVVTPGMYTADDDFSGADFVFDDLSAEGANLPRLISIVAAGSARHNQ
jgi:HAD superfamily hydrolase (TIGR01509 family)